MAEPDPRAPRDDPDGEKVVLIRVEGYADGTGLLEAADGVTDEALAAYLTHLAGVAARGEHRG